MAWLLVAAVAVIVATPRRWNGAYIRANGVHASYVPLRPITPTEGAALVKCKCATFGKLSPQAAYISTRVYLLPRSLLLLSSGEVLGVAISEIDEAPPILRPLAVFVCGFQCQYLEWN